MHMFETNYKHLILEVQKEKKRKEKKRTEQNRAALSAMLVCIQC